MSKITCGLNSRQASTPSSQNFIVLRVSSTHLQRSTTCSLPSPRASGPSMPVLQRYVTFIKTQLSLVLQFPCVSIPLFSLPFYAVRMCFSVSEGFRLSTNRFIVPRIGSHSDQNVMSYVALSVLFPFSKVCAVA